jgi:hypothetical protein
MPWQAAPPRKIELARGDKIVVISGDFDGLTGTVDGALNDEIRVIIDPHLRAEGIPDEFLFNIHDLMKRFDIGDSVVVSRGTDFGNSGIVVGIGDFRAAFLRSARAYTLMSPTDSASRILTITHGTRSFKSRMEDCYNPAGEPRLMMLIPGAGADDDGADDDGADDDDYADDDDDDDDGADDDDDGADDDDDGADDADDDDDDDDADDDDADDAADDDDDDDVDAADDDDGADDDDYADDAGISQIFYSRLFPRFCSSEIQSEVACARRQFSVS